MIETAPQEGLGASSIQCEYARGGVSGLELHEAQLGPVVGYGLRHLLVGDRLTRRAIVADLAAPRDSEIIKGDVRNASVTGPPELSSRLMKQFTVEQAMAIALGHHQAGRLAEAEGLYRQVLARFPDHASALHLLGVLAGQSGHFEAALDLIGRAIAADSDVAEYHGNLGEICRRSGRWEIAIRSLRRAVELKPSLIEAHINLGTILLDHNRFDEAIDALRKAVELSPDHAEAHNKLGVALHQMGRSGEAIIAFRRTIQLHPDHADAWSNLCLALLDAGRLDEAIAVASRAIQLKPDHAAAHNNLGLSLHKTGRLDEAVNAFQNAIRLRPDYAEALNNLGLALHQTGRLGEAIEAFQLTIQLKPLHADARSNLGLAFHDVGRPDEAIDALRNALQLVPDDVESHNNLGHVLRETGRLDHALSHFRRAVELKPDCSTAASNFVFSLYFHPHYDAQRILAEHRQWASQFADPLTALLRPHPNDRAPDRKLRIGYVSPDFRAHPVGRLLLPLFSHHDHHQVEIVCYSDVRKADAVTEKLKAMAGLWCDTVRLSDQQMADRVRDDRIDILVDLALHSAGNRLRVFARKPAPVQVTMLGLPATTGLATIDYRLTDPYLDPPGRNDTDYTEHSIRLPHCYWIFQPPPEAPSVGPLPAETDGFVTFGCLNQFAKVSLPTLQLWVRILQLVPASRLVVQSQPGRHLDAMYQRFQQGGIAPDRLEFVARVPQRDYFRRFHAIDLGLDPFPYNGHTSSLDSLWMGVPFVTLAGHTAVGRGGVSILSNIGLPELIAQTSEQYVEIAVRCASDLPRLRELRAGLRQQMQSSALMDGKQFAEDVEGAFRQMWKTACQ